MPGDVIGDPLWAVLIPPRLARFRELTGLGDAAITADFSGWNKYVLLARDRVFLFPREAGNVEWLTHELAVYRALAAGGFTLAPRVRWQWQVASSIALIFDLLPLRGAAQSTTTCLRVMATDSVPSGISSSARATARSALPSASAAMLSAEPDVVITVRRTSLPSLAKSCAMVWISC